MKWVVAGLARARRKAMLSAAPVDGPKCETTQWPLCFWNQASVSMILATMWLG